LSQETDSKIEQWLEVVKNPALSLVEKGLNLAKIVEYPDLDIKEYTGRIEEIGTSLREAVSDVNNATYLISVLNEHLFDNFGLTGDEDDYYNPKNNFVNEVIDRKSGLPITVSIIYAEVAKYIGLELQIVGFPSHILVKFKEELIIDPFYGGRVLGVEELQQILDLNFGGGVEFLPEFLDSISDEKTLARMARNLKNSYMQSYAFEKAELCIDLVMALEQNVPEDVRDRGIAEEGLSRLEPALVHLKQYLEMSPNAEDADFVLDLIRDIRARA